jgi:putative phage-type endonuclease
VPSLSGLAGRRSGWVPRSTVAEWSRRVATSFSALSGSELKEGEMLDRQAWLEERRKGLGSSDAPIVTGDSPWGSEYTLARQKRGLDPIVDSRDPILSYGRRIEAVIADIYADETGRKLRRVNRTMRHPKAPELFAHPDREVVGERRLVEAKSSWRPWDADDVPRHVQVQVQHQMAVTGAEVTDVALLAGFADFRIYEIARDDAVIGELVELERAWWRRYVVGNELPPVDDSPAGRRALDALAGGPDMVASDEQKALMARLRTLREQEERIAKVEKPDVIRALKESMVGSYVLVGPDFRVTWKPTKPTTHTDWRLVANAYRRLIEAARDMHGMDEAGWDDWGADVQADALDALVSLHSETREGTRPFRPKWMDIAEEEAA